MSLAQIKDKIESGAKQEVEQISEKFRAHIHTVRSRATEEIALMDESTRGRIEKERPEIFKRRKIVVELDVKRLLLGSKRHLIQDVFDSALVKLQNLESGPYLAFCEKLLLQASETGEEEIRVSQEEKYLDERWVDDFNAKHGKKIVFSSEKLPIAGGFLLSNGRIHVNCSWDSLIQVMQENRETEVVKRLFPS